MKLETQIKKLGLSDKQATVYLAALELGPSPAQRLSRRVKIARGTTYLVLDSLINRGLISKGTVDRRTVFTAEPPEKLLQFIEVEELALRQKQQEVINLMPKLHAVTRKADNKPWVEYFDGVEGLKTIRQKMLRQSNSKEIWYGFTPVDHLLNVFGTSEFSYINQRRAKGIRSKVIFTTTSQSLKDQLLKEQREGFLERKFIDPAVYNSQSGMSMFGSRIAIGNYTDQPSGVIIESESLANMFRSFFELLWQGLPE